MLPLSIPPSDIEQCSVLVADSKSFVVSLLLFYYPALQCSPPPLHSTEMQVPAILPLHYHMSLPIHSVLDFPFLYLAVHVVHILQSTAQFPILFPLYSLCTAG